MSVCVDSGQMVQDSWSRVTSVCDPSFSGGERKKDNIDREELFEEEYFSQAAIAKSWQTELRGGRGGSKVRRGGGVLSEDLLNRFGGRRKRRRWSVAEKD